MTFTANNNTIYKNEINQLTVSLKQYFDNETKEIYEYGREFDLPLDVTFYTDAGNLATKKLVNGTATFDFNPQDNVSAVYAKINHQILKLEDFQMRKTDIIVKDIEKYYGSGSKLTVKLVKDNGAPVSNEELNVSFEGREYSIKTDKNGIAKLTLKNSPNKYSVKISFNGTNYI